MMIEVFKTNVVDRDQANRLIVQIQQHFSNYMASFDLEDCDRILVIKCVNGIVHTSMIIDLLKTLGHVAEVLPDEYN
jgi:hypothetical protein